MKCLHHIAPGEQKYLKVGRLTINSNRNEINIVVTKLDEIINVIIPHFDKYPVRGGKLISYLIFLVFLLYIIKKHKNRNEYER